MNVSDRFYAKEYVKKVWFSCTLYKLSKVIKLTIKIYRQFG